KYTGADASQTDGATLTMLEGKQKSLTTLWNHWFKYGKNFADRPPPHAVIVNPTTDTDFPHVSSLRVINTKCDDASAYYRHDVHNGRREPKEIGSSKELFPGYGDSFFTIRTSST
ncbi:MAG: hypothetical protein OXC40_00035, partial [Proteobacteria bacterium]|nr:hypothetical protein [Pseudomonadota bacterium]